MFFLNVCVNLENKPRGRGRGCCGLISFIWSDQNRHRHRNPADHQLARKRGKPEVTSNGDRVFFYRADKLIQSGCGDGCTPGTYTNTHPRNCTP